MSQNIDCEISLEIEVDIIELGATARSDMRHTDPF